MSLGLAVAVVVFTIITLLLAIVTYQLGYHRGWLAGTADTLQDVYVEGGDADD